MQLTNIKSKGKEQPVKECIQKGTMYGIKNTAYGGPRWA